MLRAPRPQDTLANHIEKGMSQSALKELRRAPACYRYRFIDGGQQEETDAMRMGTALHTAVLEPDRWEHEIAVEEKVDGRTTAGKAYRERFAAESAGKTIIKAGQAETILAAAAALRAHPHADTLLAASGSLFEQEITWTDEETGILCRGRPDLVVPSLGIAVDIKSTSDATPHGFASSAAGMGYDIQAAYYLDGLRANGIEVDTWLWLVVEMSAPHLTAAYQADELDLDAARVQYRRDLRVWKHCVETGDWPGLDTAVMPLSLPFWAQKQRAKAQEVE